MKRSMILLSALSIGIAGYGQAANAPAATSLSTAAETQPAPALDRFSSSDDQKLGVEVRGVIVETVGPDDAKEIFIFVDRGDVQLTGKVKSEDKKRAIVDALRANKGVKSVNNKLTATAPAKK
jgi:hypothetical protein